jgi:ATP-dependent 26S proteasome regulatory subunit
VLKDEGFYIGIRSNRYDFVVLEDIDSKLGPRKEGNDLMHKFLSMSDGFVANKTKIIFTTNLDVGQMDPALVRPGRCYARVSMQELTCSQASALARKLTDRPVELIEGKKRYTVAEVYNLVYDLSRGDVNPVVTRAGF